MHILFTDEEIRLLEALEAAEVDPVTIIVHLFMKFGANYDQLTETVNRGIQRDDPAFTEEFTEALVVGVVNMKREVSEVE